MFTTVGHKISFVLETTAKFPCLEALEFILGTICFSKHHKTFTSKHLSKSTHYTTIKQHHFDVNTHITIQNSSCQQINTINTSTRHIGRRTRQFIIKLAD
jgi:hypothetical protein